MNKNKRVISLPERMKLNCVFNKRYIATAFIIIIFFLMLLEMKMVQKKPTENNCPPVQIENNCPPVQTSPQKIVYIPTKSETTLQPENYLSNMTTYINDDYVVISQTKTVPPYLYSGPMKQSMLRYIREKGLWGASETQIFKEICISRCDKSKPYDKNPLVLDVGGNIGMFTLYSLAMGCRVQSYEAIYDPYYFMTFSIHLNGFGKGAKVFNKGIDKEPGTIEITRDASRDWGVSGVGINSGTKENVETTALYLEIKEDLLLLKIDVEGFEDNVIEGLMPVFENYNIENILLEMKNRRNTKIKRDFINFMIKSGYKVISFHEDIFSEEALKRKFLDIVCREVEEIGENDWIPYEDVWFVKIGAPSYSMAKQLKCME